MNENIKLVGCWENGIAISYHNADPVCLSRYKSINQEQIRMTEIGNSIKEAKYHFSISNFNKLRSILLDSADRIPHHDLLFFVPSRDSNTYLNIFLANVLAKRLRIDSPEPAFDWQEYINFEKGMGEYEIDELILNNITPFISIKSNDELSILVFDDTYRTGSTITLAVKVLKRYFPNAIINILCITKVMQFECIHSDNEFKHIETLYKNEWLDLKRIRTKYTKGDGYVFSHESRCSGKIIAMLPFKKTNGEFEYLLRCERTPCWENKLTPSSFTGGIEKGHSPVFTAAKELYEESGIQINQSDIVALGTSFGTKSIDSTYYLFGVNLERANIADLVNLDDLWQKKPGVKWLKAEEAVGYGDPLVSVIILRLDTLLNRLDVPN